MNNLELLQKYDEYFNIPVDPSQKGLSGEPSVVDLPDGKKPSALEIQKNSILYKDTLNYKGPTVKANHDFQDFEKGSSLIKKSEQLSFDSVDADDAKKYIKLAEELLNEILGVIDDNGGNYTFEQIINDVFKSESKLHEENAGDVKEMIEESRQERLKISKERREKMEELLSEMKKTKTWQRMVNISSGLAAAAATIGSILTGGTLAIALGVVAGIVAIGDSIDREYGNPVKEGIVKAFTGDEDQEKIDQNVTYFSVGLNVISLACTGGAFFFRSGAAAIQSGSKLVEVIIKKFLPVAKTLSGGLGGVSSGLQAHGKYKSDLHRADMIQLEERFEGLGKRMQALVSQIKQELESMTQQQSTMTEILKNLQQVNQQLMR